MAREFRIGLTMAGAISAGAYTAGVFDFLVRALAAWEAERSGDDTRHKVRLVAMSGASAGGMTAVLGTIALARGLQPAPNPADPALPDLYRAWVKAVAMVSDGICLLSDEDLADGKVLSLLNARLLDDICDKALAVPSPPPLPPAMPFLAEPLHLYLTETNLRGIEYDIAFANGDVYRMLNHGDRKHYKVTGLGGDPAVASAWAGQDPGQTLVADRLNQAGKDSEWGEAGRSALATGAFPVGLAARVLDAARGDYQGRQWPIPTEGATVSPAWPKDWSPVGDRFDFVTVDGGAINNEPFELARYAVKDDLDRNQRDGGTANRAVIMVAPFPEGYAFPRADSLDDRLMAVIKALLPTFMQQARFKADELVAAAAPDIYSRFLIAPKRTDSKDVTSKDIACGLLGGFGGFLDESFRRHDFQLGQRNCQEFLRNHFTLPNSNVLFGGDGTNPSAGQTLQDLPIVPLIGVLGTEIGQPDWPRMSMGAYSTLVQHIGSRADKLVPLLLKQEVGSGFLRWLLKLAWNTIPFWSIRDKVIEAARLAILADLIRRDQIDDCVGDTFPPEDGGGPRPGGLSEANPLRLRNFKSDEREVLARLTDSSFDLRTVAGIVKDTGLDAIVVQNTLVKACEVPDGGTHKVWCSEITQNGAATYALDSRKLGFFKTMPLLGGLVRKVSGVSIG